MTGPLGSGSTGAGPSLPSSEAVTEVARELIEAAHAAREGGARVLAAWRPISLHYDAAEAVDLFTAMNPVERVTDEHAEVLGSVARILGDFADDVGRLEAQAAAVDARRDQWPEAGSSDSAEPCILRRLEHGLSEAEDAAVSRLSALGAAHYRLPVGEPPPPLSISGAAAWAAVLPAFDRGVRSTGLGLLSSLLARRDLAAWAEAHPRRLRALLDDPPDATRVRAWWSALGRSEQEALIAGVPLVVGNLDGVTLADRGRANRSTLRREIARLEGSERPPVRDRRDEAAVQHEAEVLASCRRIQEQSAHSVLVAFDPEDESFVTYVGRLDPVTGELPAATRHIGVLIPGTGTNPATWSQETPRAQKVLSTIGQTQDVGIFTWAGGRFPQFLDAVSADDSATLGPRLGRFVDSVRPTTGATITAVGYSYGGAVLGMAEKTGIDIDRSVAVSSAGLGNGVRSVDDYARTSAIPHYAMMAPGDRIVGYTQSLQAGDLGHGGSPVDPRSGFERLETGYRDSEAGAASGQLTGHVGVWNGDSGVVQQVGRAIAGGQVELYARPEIVGTTLQGDPILSNPIMEPGYEPVLERVRGERG